MLAAGALNRRITIQRKTDVPDGSGGYDRAWADLTTVWAKATPVAGKEALVAGTLRSSQPWRVEIRWLDVKVDERITASWLPSGKHLEIQSVSDPDGRRESLVLFCETA